MKIDAWNCHNLVLRSDLFYPLGLDANPIFALLVFLNPRILFFVNPNYFCVKMQPF